MTRGKPVFWLAAAAAAAGACAQVVGVDGYKDAIEELCGPCDDAIPDCSGRLSQSLAAATDEDVRGWLATYNELGCEAATCQLELSRCFYAAPGLCLESGAACEASESCCGFDFVDHRKGAGCCDGGGNSACCERCHTCAERIEAYAAGKPFDDATLCRSQAGSWKDLLACTQKNDPMKPGMKICEVSCAGPPATSELCKACLAKDCQAEFQACGNNAGL